VIRELSKVQVFRFLNQNQKKEKRKKVSANARLLVTNSAFNSFGPALFSFFFLQNGHRIFGKMVLFTFTTKSKNFQDSASHRIFKRMHEVLNIDENKN